MLDQVQIYGSDVITRYAAAGGMKSVLMLSPNCIRASLNGCVLTVPPLLVIHLHPRVTLLLSVCLVTQGCRRMWFI